MHSWAPRINGERRKMNTTSATASFFPVNERTFVQLVATYKILTGPDANSPACLSFAIVRNDCPKILAWKTSWNMIITYQSDENTYSESIWLIWGWFKQFDYSLSLFPPQNNSVIWSVDMPKQKKHWEKWPWMSALSMGYKYLLITGGSFFGKVSLLLMQWELGCLRWLGTFYTSCSMGLLNLVFHFMAEDAAHTVDNAARLFMRFIYYPLGRQKADSGISESVNP